MYSNVYFSGLDILQLAKNCHSLIMNKKSIRHFTSRFYCWPGLHLEFLATKLSITFKILNMTLWNFDQI